jgi:hypothetical protein
MSKIFDKCDFNKIYLIMLTVIILYLFYRDLTKKEGFGQA